MNRSRLLVVSYRVIRRKKRATSGAFFGVCEMVHIRGARVLLVMFHRRFPLRDCLGKAVWIGLALLGF
jgi:hypothetical protein